MNVMTKEERYKAAMAMLVAAGVFISPSEKEADALSTLAQLLTENCDAKSAVQQMLQSLLDGLRFNNWPFPDKQTT